MCVLHLHSLILKYISLHIMRWSLAYLLHTSTTQHLHTLSHAHCITPARRYGWALLLIGCCLLIECLILKLRLSAVRRAFALRLNTSLHTLLGHTTTRTTHTHPLCTYIFYVCVCVTYSRSLCETQQPGLPYLLILKQG